MCGVDNYCKFKPKTDLERLALFIVGLMLKTPFFSCVSTVTFYNSRTHITSVWIFHNKKKNAQKSHTLLMHRCINRSSSRRRISTAFDLYCDIIILPLTLPLDMSRIINNLSEKWRKCVELASLNFRSG